MRLVEELQAALEAHWGPGLTARASHSAETPGDGVLPPSRSVTRVVHSPTCPLYLRLEHMAPVFDGSGASLLLEVIHPDSFYGGDPNGRESGSATSSVSQAPWLIAAQPGRPLCPALAVAEALLRAGCSSEAEGGASTMDSLR